MKRFLLLIFIIFACLGAWCQDFEDDFAVLDDTDKELLKGAVELVDNGMAQSALTDFKYLIKKYPDNYLVKFEYLLTLYVLGDYTEVTKNRDYMLKAKESSALGYQIIGNAYDMLGNRKEAERIYNDGLKRFPDSGLLYTELGNFSANAGEYNKAIEYFNQGTVVDPNFAALYYGAASLYFSFEETYVWGLMFADTYILLEPTNMVRCEQMGCAIAECFVENVEVRNENDSLSVSVTLVPDRGISVDQKNGVSYLAFPGVYEGAVTLAAGLMQIQKEKPIGRIEELSALRKGAIEFYYSVSNNMYGNSMYVLEYQKQIIDAGLWDAYSYFIFRGTFPDEFEEWYEENSDRFEEFVDWYNAHPFVLGDGRSVNPIQIFNSYMPIDLMEALRIQAGFLDKE